MDIKKTILAALETYRGDNAERGRRSFKGLSAEQMNQQYGQSGKTYAELLRSWEDHEREVDAAIAHVKRVM